MVVTPCINVMMLGTSGNIAVFILVCILYQVSPTYESYLHI